MDQSRFVGLHNAARKVSGAAPVGWDDEIAQAAQCWANRCRFEHSHTDNIGENIATGSGTSYGIVNAVDDWWEEYKMWRPGMGFGEATGHFTQMVWKTTKNIGCGVARCPSSQMGLGGTFRNSIFVVCQYYPAGNVIGSFDKQVRLPTTKINLAKLSSSNSLGDVLPGTKSDSYGPQKDTEAAPPTPVKQSKGNTPDDNYGSGRPSRHSAQPITSSKSPNNADDYGAGSNSHNSKSSIHDDSSRMAAWRKQALDWINKASTKWNSVSAINKDNRSGCDDDDEYGEGDGCDEDSYSGRKHKKHERDLQNGELSKGRDRAVVPPNVLGGSLDRVHEEGIGPRHDKNDVARHYEKYEVFRRTQSDPLQESKRGVNIPRKHARPHGRQF